MTYNTGNPLGSTDARDLSDNAANLDKAMHSEAATWTDRFGVARPTFRGAESELNQKVEDAEAAATQALGYLNTMRATSYGPLAEDPTVDPLGNPCTAGDEYFNTTYNLLKRFDGSLWRVPDINTENLASGAGSSMVGHGSQTVEAALAERLPEIGTYALLRAYTGPVTSFLVRGVANIFDGGHGVFRVVAGDTTSSDNGGTMLIDASGRRWRRDYQGDAQLDWFGASASASAAANTAAINAAFASGAPKMCGTPGASYGVNGQINIPNGVYFDGRGCVFSASLAAGGKLLYITNAATLANLTLDFNNGYAIRAIDFPTANVGFIELKNVVVRNILDIDTTTLTIPVRINVDRNEIRVDGLTLLNIKKRTDGNTTSIGGGVEGVYLAADTAGTVCGGGYMRNLRFVNIRTIDASGNDAEDVCNSIYFALSAATDPRANITVDGVYGYDFGRRMFKTQCSDLIIKNVYANAATQAAFAVLGLQDLDTVKTCNIKVKDVIIRGKVRYGAAVSADDTLLDGLDIDISLAGSGSSYGNNALGIGISGDNLTITNSHIKSKVGLYATRATGNFAGLIKGLNVSNTLIATGEAGAQFFDISSSTSIASVDSATFSNVILDGSAYPAAISQIGNVTNISNLVNFQDVTIIDNDATANGGSYIYAYGFKTVGVNGFTHFNRHATSLVFRSLRFSYVTSLMLSNVNLQAKPNAASISMDNVTSLVVNGLYVDPAATYSLSLTTTASSRLTNVERSKVIFNDTASTRGGLFAPEFSSGATGARPTAGLLVGQQHWDTSLSKPIWWNGTVWKDAAGTTA